MLFRSYAKDIIAQGMRYCVRVDICSAFELCSWLVYKMGESLAKKVLPPHTIKHYKIRAEEITKEEADGRY